MFGFEKVKNLHTYTYFTYGDFHTNKVLIHNLFITKYIVNNQVIHDQIFVSKHPFCDTKPKQAYITKNNDMEKQKIMK